MTDAPPEARTHDTFNLVADAVALINATTGSWITNDKQDELVAKAEWHPPRLAHVREGLRLALEARQEFVQLVRALELALVGDPAAAAEVAGEQPC